MPNPNRKTSGFRDVSAWCQECDKRWDSKNAQAVAAKHTGATGHTTNVEARICWTYEIEGVGG